MFFRSQKKRNPVCFLKSNLPLLTQSSWSLAASCCSSVDSGCSAPLCGFTDPPTNSHQGIRPQRKYRDQVPKEEMELRPDERPAPQYRRTGGLTATLRGGWSSPESCARPGTVASFQWRPIPRQPPQVCPGVSTLQIFLPIHWCR